MWWRIPRWYRLRKHRIPNLNGLILIMKRIWNLSMLVIWNCDLLFIFFEFKYSAVNYIYSYILKNICFKYKKFMNKNDVGHVLHWNSMLHCLYSKHIILLNQNSCSCLYCSVYAGFFVIKLSPSAVQSTCIQGRKLKKTVLNPEQFICVFFYIDQQQTVYSLISSAVQLPVYSPVSSSATCIFSCFQCSAATCIFSCIQFSYLYILLYPVQFSYLYILLYPV